MHLVLLFALGMQTLEAFLCADDYKHLDLEKRALVKKKWYSFMGFGRKETPFSAFSAVVIQHVSHSAGKDEETFIARVGFKTQDGSPVLRVKEFPTKRNDIPAEAENFAREVSATTGLPYCGHIGSG